LSERTLLLGDDIGVFLAVARSLGRRGHEVHLVPAELDAPALSSRYIAALHTLPAYHLGPAAWLEGLQRLVREQQFDLIVPCSDAGLHLLHEHRDALGPERLLLPNEAAFEAFTDKGKTRALAGRLGIRVAKGQTAGTDAEPLADELGLPLVLKPPASYRPGDPETKQRAEVVRSLAALRESLASGRQSWLAESYAPGEGVGVSVLARGGEILLAVQHRRLQTLSETGGGSDRVTEAIDPRLLADVGALARAVSLTGPAMFEFRQDRRPGGGHVLLEVNARFWGSLPLAVAAGADFPALAFDANLGREIILGEARPGVRKTNLSGEIDRLALALEGAGGKASALVSLAGLVVALPFPQRFDSWAGDDPAPWREERRLALERLTRPILGRRRSAPQRAAVTRPAT
jgi:predicted ATP-grasp superfamily ATP-dependent carboligase